MQILHFNIYNLTVFIHILYDYIIPKTLVSFLYLHCHSFLFFLIISSLILLCLLHEIPPLPWIANIKLCYIYSLSFPGSFFFFFFFTLNDFAKNPNNNKKKDADVLRNCWWWQYWNMNLVFMN